MSDNKPPCECIESVNGRWTYRCECSNGGDAEGAAYWVAYENARIETADTITRLTAEVERLRAALERAEGGFYHLANSIDDYDYHGPAPQCTGDIIGHREQFHRVHVEQLVEYAEECRAALGFTPLHKETSNERTL